jgi:hypothetical protein
VAVKLGELLAPARGLPADRIACGEPAERTVRGRAASPDRFAVLENLRFSRGLRRRTFPQFARRWAALGDVFS